MSKPVYLLLLLVISGTFAFIPKAMLTRGMVNYELIVPAMEPSAARIQKIKSTVKDPILQRSIIQKIRATPDPQPYALFFDNEISVFKRLHPKGFPDAMKNTQPLGEIYKNTQKKKLIESKFIFQKKFIISEKMPKIVWTQVDSTREILPFKAKMAKAIIDSIETEVWYTTEIPVQTGPDNLWGLDGLILEVYYANRKALHFKGFSATIPEDVSIEAPTKGTAISREEFHKEAMKRYDSMNEHLKKQRGDD